MYYVCTFSAPSVYIDVCKCVCMYVCVYVYIHVYVHLCVRVSVFMYVMCVRVSKCR